MAESTTTARLAAAATLLLIWVRGIAFLHAQHPHEDAFILFRYAENVAAGRGIVFNPGGSPAEGATDFLWMLLVAGGNALGLDSAIVALFLSACGAAVLSYVVVRAWTGDGSSSRAVLLTGLCLGVTVPFLPPAHSAYAGFSTLLYCGLFALTLWLTSLGRAGAGIAATYLSLALGLLRPDGVILAAGCFFLAVSFAPPEARRRLLGHGVVAVLVGAGYFAWRYNYFGYLLPLPLYVKSRAVGEVARLQMNLRWLESGLGPVSLLISTGILAALAGLRRSIRPLLLLVPGTLLFVALWRAHQTQNVDWRFQAPVYTGGLLAVAMLAARVRSRRPGAAWLWLSSLLVAGALGPAIYTGRYVFERDYMDSAAVKLGPLLDGKTVVLTEAGRLAYWSNATVVDVVGLNTPEMALRPPSVSFLEAAAPDVVMFHLGGTVDGRKMVRGKDRKGRVAPVSPKRLRRAVRGPYRSYLGSERDEYISDDVATKISAAVLVDFLSQHPEYQIVAVRYGRGFNHVYGFRSDLEDREAMLEALASAGPSAPESSYASVRGMRPGLACRIGAWVSPDLPSAAQICASDG